MKITSSVLYPTLACCVLIISQVAQAEESSATLEVTGTLTPGSCTPTLSNSGIIDYGTIYGMGLIAVSNQLGVKNIDLTIVCDSPTMVAVYSTDNRADSQAAVEIKNSWNSNSTISTPITKQRYGLGKTTAGKPIGAFSIGVDLEGLTVDAQAVSAIELLVTSNVNASNVSWTRTSTGALYEHSYSSWDAVTPGYYDYGRFYPIAFTNATLPLIISAAVSQYNTLDTKDEINLDGNVTLSMVYL